MPIVTRFTLAITLLVFGSAFAQSAVQVELADDLVSVQANNASARELADELANQLGIKVVVMGNTETRVDLDISEEPMDKALAKLSPNTMLMHNDDATDITGVVLMMGSLSTGVSGDGPDAFLPSGSPVEAVVQDQGVAMPLEQQDLEASRLIINSDDLRDPERAVRVREAAQSASSDPNLPAAQVPPMFAEEATGIDPNTGLPYQQ